MILAAMLIIVFLVSFNIGRFEGIPFKDTVLIMLSAIFPIDATWPQNHETFIGAMASTIVHGDPEQYKKGRKVKVRLLYGEKTLKRKARKMLEQNED